MKFDDIVFVYQMKEEREIRWHSRHHNHEAQQYEIHYFIQGNGTFLNRQTVYQIKPGSLFLTNPGQYHAIHAHQDDAPLSYYALLFTIEEESRNLLNHLDQTVFKSRGYYEMGPNYRFFFEELKEKAQSGKDFLKRSAEYQFLSMLYELAENRKGTHYTDEGNAHIERALRLMQNAVFQEINLDSIAAKLNLSPSYFIRIFRKKMKTTPMKYFTKLKVEAASSLLSGTDIPLYKIARQLNFYSEFHFSRIFKQYTGTAPSSYRKQYRFDIDMMPDTETEE